MTENKAIEKIKWIMQNKSHNKEFCLLCIKALEEIQQYRAIETELREQYHANVDIKMLMQHFIETIFKGIIPFVFLMILAVVLITFIPDIALWLPYTLMGPEIL